MSREVLLELIKASQDYAQSLEQANVRYQVVLAELYDRAADTEDNPLDAIELAKPTISQLDRKIIETLDILGYSEDALNRWCGRQFTDFAGNWREMPDERKSAVYATFQSKVDEQVATVK
jgi:hypothetical protein